jgi:hypothetical protein
MTDAELKAIEDRCNAATAPPWLIRTIEVYERRGCTLHLPDKDLHFAMESRQDVPALLAEVRQLRRWKAEACAVEEMRADLMPLLKGEPEAQLGKYVTDIAAAVIKRMRNEIKTLRADLSLRDMPRVPPFSP